MRTWKVLTTSYWLRSVAPFLTGLEFGDSPLVILYLCSLAHSFVISIFSFCFFFIFFLGIFLTLPYDFLHEVVFLNIHLITYPKKKKKKKRSFKLDSRIITKLMMQKWKEKVASKFLITVF